MTRTESEPAPPQSQAAAASGAATPPRPAGAAPATEQPPTSPDTPRSYLLSSAEEADRLVAEIESRFEVLAEEVRESSDYLDTFDWRLWQRGLALCVQRSGSARGASSLVLRDLQGTVRHRLPGSGAIARVEDLAPCPLRDAIARTVSPRHLLPALTVRRSARLLRILDAEKKTVARLSVEERSAAAAGRRRQLPRVARLLPVRGYRNVDRRLRQVLEQGLGLAPVPGDELQECLARLEIEPGRSSSKIQVVLDPQLPARAAVRLLHRDLLRVIRLNEAGVRQDLDIEFLHDFRVAVRRTRSLLTQVKRVLPERDVERFSRGFSWLGSVTGPTRDLHVYLEKLHGYRSSLPDDVASRLDPLEELLRTELAEEHRKLVRALDTARYRRLLDSWEAFLDRDPKPPRAGGAVAAATTNAARPIVAVASNRIRKVYRRLLASGEAITDGSPDSDLHRLRIRAKKLRYLMELFRSLYPRAMDEQIKALKRLQDLLGEHQDYTVQRAALAGYAERLGAGCIETQQALGRLFERLEQGQAEERARFARTFARFASSENRVACKRLLRERQ